MRYGIITDIHSNLTALRAVLKQLDRMNCDRIICCGDIIGIGPNPEETVQEMIDYTFQFFSLWNAPMVLRKTKCWHLSGEPFT